MEDDKTQTHDEKGETKTEEKEEIKQDEQEANDAVSAANVVAARLESANKETARLLARQEKLKVQETLGGKAEAGPPLIAPTKEERDIEAARDFLKGTGYEDELFPKKSSS